MDKPRLLCGDELVARGITKIDVTLPEVGLKDIVPNGTWLEQKQIQSALEARKHMIEVQRIEKSGVLSQAKWCEELMLAEVSKNTGGHWQYIGHNIGKQLYLKPEEALYLIEVNCLRLTYNDVTVSLQQAYSLLLRSKVSLLQYKVYASLSRIGYKVYRHEDKNNKTLTNYEKKIKLSESPKKEILSTKCDEVEKKEVRDNKENEMAVDDTESKNSCNVTNECVKEVNVPENLKAGIVKNQEIKPIEKDTEEEEEEGKKCKEIDTVQMEVCNGVSENSTNDINADCDKTNGTGCIHADTNKTDETEHKEENMITDNTTEDRSNAQDTMENIVKENEKDNKIESISDDIKIKSEKFINSMDEEKNEFTNNNTVDSNFPSQNSKLSEPYTKKPEVYHQHKLKILENRKVRPLNVKNTEKCFEKVPDISQNQIVTVNVPEEKFIPRNVYLNNTSYVLNLESIKCKTKGTVWFNNSRTYSTNEEVNGEHIKRIKAATGSNIPVTTHIPPPFTNNRFSRPTFFNFWRPNMSFFPYNFMFQRPFIPNNFLPRLRVFSPRPSLLGEYPRFASFQSNEQRSVPNQSRKRRNSVKQRESHLQAIKNLAMRLKELIQSGNTQQENVDSLQRLINTFNTKYNMRLRLTENFEVFNNETIVETISLDEDEEPTTKKVKSDDNKCKENLNMMKQLALKLKGLESKEKITSRHRRAFSNLIKKFNKSYNADVYINSNFEVIDRKLINLDSSSDSDCVIEETTKATGSKKLKNPFNILKRLSEKRNITTNSNTNKDGPKVEEIKSNNYSTTTIQSFSKNWLPNEDDFGRAEILPKTLTNSYLLHSKREEFLYDFFKSQPYEFDTWMDIKLSFLKSIEETDTLLENDITETTPINSLIGPDDCTDMPAVLKKLSIISSNKAVDTESILTIDFDVYNRDVQNFKKSNRPKPHFRVICISETSSFPSSKDVASLHMKYDDNTTLVFAVVGVGSISYLQINPIDLPTYIPASDLE